ncbi:hypothetical protein PHYBLDRAFT_71055 [Phycomyces blakesleeanus NRRL 1555(-)]|uniref:Uncharacterized protein n=1 Tax=Phycomyces blakesleeanus (strain ATCC 8743b / DSM 1359 / FGSC 10004 / NBRC 33097 / NRRL 1555) TaxID=763407 RepID=A0A167J764_PHYB8|nr:hypothetical protein PHYBLDRAFT_71055 [Phycomyces blakesleeanus NRRL 1555(-)]OAD65348.1 hypothetical protein PHYBLDRAFT_71055 [Phycomyces blakesleeanus NRRL 1555(-)]|eukprot:XP_018283388.1 hypothetical protein PHYBLDRAFT_71055 [Phycomyces blakesleeanus NRRL 1555(-)]
MHNLYLGTAKQMINIWRDSKLISDKDFLTMQELANGVVVPSGYARITKKIGDGFSFMKADEWKSCKCINDFGLVYAFWLFSFERYNGLLKNFETNQKGGFESTMMKQFLEKAYISSYIRAFSTSLDKFIITFLHSISNSQPHLPLQSDSSAFKLPQFVKFSSNPRKLSSGWESLPPATFPIKLEKMITMCKEHYNCLLEFYRHVYNSHNLFAHYSDHHSSQIFVNNRIEKIKRISLLRQEYSSGSYFQAFFLEHKGEDISAFPGHILYLFQHILNINGKDVVHTFAFVEWYTSYASGSYQPLMTEKIELWNEPLTTLKYDCILPVHCLYSLIAVARYKLNITSDFKRLVIPFLQKIEA